jgi:hypothetical protein
LDRRAGDFLRFPPGWGFDGVVRMNSASVTFNIQNLARRAFGRRVGVSPANGRFSPAGGTPALHTGKPKPNGLRNKIARSIPIAILQSIVLTLLCPVALFAASPRIACETATFDFGTRDSSEIVEHIFELKNTGDSDLVITAIRPACGCTAAELTNSTIPPGESAKLATKLTLAGRSGDVHKTILIESNDPANPAFQLGMQGKIVTEVAVVPSVLTLRQSAPGQPASGTVQITANGKPFRITQAASSDPAIRVRSEPITDGATHQISASLEKMPESDPQPLLIMLQTDTPRVPTIDIPATVVLMKKILVAPEKIFIPTGEVSLTKTVILKFPPNNIKNIQNISTPSPSINVVPTKFNDQIRLEVSGFGRSKDFEGNYIKIQFEDGEIIVIPFLIKN